MPDVKDFDCFYCGCPLLSRGEWDHFPLPQDCGGEATVPACLTCHDLKDRVKLTNWPAGFFLNAILSMPREGRLLLAKVMAMSARQEKANRRRYRAK